MAAQVASHKCRESSWGGDARRGTAAVAVIDVAAAVAVVAVVLLVLLLLLQTVLSVCLAVCRALRHYDRARVAF